VKEHSCRTRGRSNVLLFLNERRYRGFIEGLTGIIKRGEKLSKKRLRSRGLTGERGQKDQEDLRGDKRHLFFPLGE